MSSDIGDLALASDLASPAGLWHCDTRFTDKSTGLMRPSVTSVTRTLQKARRLFVPVLLVCLFAAAADAAPRTRRHQVARHPVKRVAVTTASCGTSLTLRALQRQSRSVAGPVARTSTALHAGLPLPRPLLTRGPHGRLDDSDAAIVNDAPVARIDADEGVRPSLRALGLLASAFDPLPSSRVFSPRSSLGPPGLV